ncbi:fibronectin type III domain-containing protein [Candidatus Azambacteria bacterium]|nr:fibronectin type III domain-containing protein [Candidatus Azambacteria bacterium]
MIYDIVSHPVLGDAPNYGYAFSTIEDSATTTDNTATVTWSTNYNSTSRVVYDTAAHSTSSVGPNYGYAFSTSTFDPSGVTHHSVTVNGLTPAMLYYFRLISNEILDASEYSFVTQPAPVTEVTPAPPAVQAPASSQPAETSPALFSPLATSGEAGASAELPVVGSGESQPGVVVTEKPLPVVAVTAGEPAPELPQRPALFLAASVLTLGTDSTLVAIVVGFAIMLLVGGGLYVAVKKLASKDS